MNDQVFLTMHDAKVDNLVHVPSESFQIKAHLFFGSIR